MELKSLKERLNNTEPKYSREEIQSIFEIKTKHTVRSLGRIMWYDLIIMTAVAIAMISLTFVMELNHRYFISFEILLVAVALYLHYVIKRKVVYDQLSKTGIKRSIDKILNKIRYYTKLYKVLVPVIICSVYLKTSIDIAASFQFSNDQLLTILLPTLPLGYAAYRLTLWLADRLYGSTIDSLIQLKNQLSDSFE